MRYRSTGFLKGVVQNKQLGFYIIHYHISISYNTGKSALPDTYARYLRACSARGRVCIYQAKHECLCYN